MRISQLFTGFVLVCFAGVASADLEPWTDYEVSEGVSNVTTIKVHSNMIDKYLEGLRETWVPANKVAMELGHIKDYGIYVSELPNGGDRLAAGQGKVRGLHESLGQGKPGKVRQDRRDLPGHSHHYG